MEVQIGDKKFRVSWSHNTIISASRTHCVISKEDAAGNDPNYSNAFALKHPKDNFSKNKGRKISLHRALISGKFPKRERKMFWEAYYKMRGNKW